MKKLAKVLAVVLAIALLACPFASAAVVNAAAENDALTVEIAGEDNDLVRVTFESKIGFAAAIVSLDVTGVTLGEDDAVVSDYSVLTADAEPSVDVNLADGVLKFLVTSADAASLAKYVKVVVDIPVELADEFEVTATNLRAADDVNGTEDFIAVDFTDANGDIDADAANVIATVTDEDLEPAGPIVDDTLVVAKISPAYETSGMQIAFRTEPAVLNKYTDTELVVIPQKYDLATFNLVEEPVEYTFEKSDMTSIAGGRYMECTFADINLYELGLDINYMFIAHDAQGNEVVSPVYTTSVVEWFKNNIATSTNPKMVTMYVDTLIVCDESMKGMAAQYPGSQLAVDTAAGTILDGVDITKATQSIGTGNDIDSFTPYDNAYGTTSSATHRIMTSVAVDRKVPYINFRIRNAASLDMSKLAITVTYIGKYADGEHPYSKTFTGSDISVAANGIANLVFDEIGLQDNDKTITFSAVYDGNDIFEWQYSMETYEYSMKDNATTGNLMQALIKVGKSFRDANNIQ